MYSLRNVHFIIGIVGLVTFLLTGQVMFWVHQQLQGMPDGPRMFFRSAHIYLLLASLLNLLLGCYITRLMHSLANKMQLIASTLIMIAPALLCYSFFYEPHTISTARPVASWAIYILGISGVLHVVATRINQSAITE